MRVDQRLQCGQCLSLPRTNVASSISLGAVFGSPLRKGGSGASCLCLQAEKRKPFEIWITPAIRGPLCSEMSGDCKVHDGGLRLLTMNLLTLDTPG